MKGMVIGTAVAILIAAFLIPIAFDEFFGVDTGSWDTQTIVIWGLVPLFAILAIALKFLDRATDAANGFALPIIVLASAGALIAADVSAQFAMWAIAVMLVVLIAITAMLHNSIQARSAKAASNA